MSENFRFVKKKKKDSIIRCEQDSNLRTETVLDFKSNALTTRPSQLDQSRRGLRIYLILRRVMVDIYSLENTFKMKIIT